MRVVDHSVAWVKNDRNRRLGYLVVVIVSAFLIFFPRPYIAQARIVPQDTSASASSTTALLGALGGSAQSIGSLLSGGRPSNDLYMVISRSSSVKEDVIRTSKLVGLNGQFSNERQAMLWLDKHIDVHLLLGGVIEIETKLRDPDQAVVLTGIYAQAIGRHLAAFGKQIIANKRGVVSRRFAQAGTRVSQAEAEVSAFRRANNLAEPEQQLSSALIQRATSDAQLKAKEIELQTLQQFRGSESNEITSLQSDIAGLRAQIARQSSPSNGVAGPNLAGLTVVSLHYLDLYRNLRFQQAMYDIYQRSAEQVAVEELATESASYVQVIDPAHIVPDRQYNNWALAIFLGMIVLFLFTEWYAPVTGLFVDGRLHRTTNLVDTE